jgi:hypothetical protein
MFMRVSEHKKSGDFSPLLTIKLKNYENQQTEKQISCKYNYFKLLRILN